MEKIGIESAKEGLEILKGTKAFVLEQAPDFMRQVLAWKAAEAWYGLAVAAFLVAVAVALAFLVKAQFRGGKGLEQTNPAIVVPASVGFLVLGLLGTMEIFAGGYAKTLIKIHFAPKIFLLEYFAGLVK